MGVFSNDTEVTGSRKYPKVLICSMSRINSHDTFNNSLLLKNLFTGWPRECLAQIFSGGSNGDEGFCDRQYEISPHDRRFGMLFFKLKGEYADASLSNFSADPICPVENKSSQQGKMRQRAGRYILDSGLYELLFRLTPSQQLLDWAKAFNPDIILAQGYNLSFTLLPLLLKRHLNIKLAYYCSDDWPSYLYVSRDGLCTMTAPLMRRIVNRSIKQLFAETDVPFSFNDLMGEEYRRRYGKLFTTLMHCDDPERFRLAEPIRLCPTEVMSIIATGIFDESRWPQILDLEEACRRLVQAGTQVHATILASRITEEGYRSVKSCQYVELRDDPGHDLLPSYLKGADLLYLAETFDPVIAERRRYSISTKAHLFMFSQRPILVYGHSENGLVRYARREGWAHVLEQRNIDVLVECLKVLLVDIKLRQSLVSKANKVVMDNNNGSHIRNIFLNSLNDSLNN